jgi:hypothetical protein
MGHKYGLNIMRVPFVGKHVSRERIERAEQLFTRCGIWVVAIGCLFAGIRGAMVVAYIIWRKRIHKTPSEAVLNKAIEKDVIHVEHDPVMEKERAASQTKPESAG